MATWGEFAAAAPDLAATCVQRLDRYGLVYIGTVRRDGSPRVSPTEPLFAHGELYLGMMHRSRKALDLLRDPRIEILNATTDRMMGDAEAHVRGRVREVTDHGEIDRFTQACRAKIDWAPEGYDWHLFAVDVESVLTVGMADDRLTWQRWSSDTPDRVEEGDRPG
jgi:hypothetical protein